MDAHRSFIHNIPKLEATHMFPHSGTDKLCHAYSTTEYHTAMKKNGFWLYELQEQVKPIYSDRSQERGYLWEGILALGGTESLLGDGGFVT